MIRGAIDYISSVRIGGWIYPETGSIKGRMVLAFLDGQCIGSGAVERHRQDLADAGLGDGQLGFNFGIFVSDAHDIGRIVAKLEGSDLILIQAGARIATGKSEAEPQNSLQHSPTNIEWMRAHGWLDQTEFDFLKNLGRLGAYDLSLRRTKAQEKALGTALLDPTEAAQHMFSLVFLQEIGLVEQEIAGLQMLATLHVANEHQEAMVAFWSSMPFILLVVEMSHIDPKEYGDGMLDGAIEYQCGPDRLLFLDLRCRFGSHPDNGDIQLRMLSPRP